MLSRSLLTLTPLLFLSALPASSRHLPLPPQPMAAATTQDVQQNLADIVPADAFLAVHWNDPAGMIAEGKDSSFVQMLMDPRWVHAFDLGGEEAQDAEADLATLHAALSGVSDIVVWLDFSDYEWMDGAVVFGMVHGTEESLDSLLGLLPERQEVESWNGMTLSRAQDAMILRDRQWCGFMSSEDPESARETLEGLRDLAHQDEVEPGFFQQAGMAAERSGAPFEFGMQLAPLWDELIAEEGEDMPEPMRRELQAMPWLYASAHFGTGHNSDWDLVVPLAEDGYISSLLDLVGAPTREDLARIPKAATNLSAGTFDLQGFTDLIIEIMGEFTPDAEAEWEAMLAQGSQMLGVDLQADFLDQMEGTMIAFGLEDPSIEIEGLVAYGMTYIFDVHDSDPIIDTIEGVLGFLSMMGMGDDMVSEEETSWGDQWVIHVEDLMEFVLGCDSSSMIFSMDAAGVDAYQALKSEPNPEESVLAKEGFQRVLEAFDELPMSAADTDWSLRAASESILGVAEMEEDPDMVEFAEFMEYALDIATDHLGGWSGYTMETSGQRVRLLFKTR